MSDVNLKGALLSLFRLIFTQVSGEVTYNGQPLSSFLPQRTAAYVPQVLFPLSRV